MNVIDGTCIRCGRELEEGEKAHYISPAVIAGKPVSKHSTGVAWSRASFAEAVKKFTWRFYRRDSGRFGKGVMCMDCWTRKCCK